MLIGRRNVFVSTLTYELGKRHGIEGAALEFQRQLEFPDRSSLPVARLISRLRTLHDVQVYHGAGTYLPKARSRAAHAAWASKADYWLMCDDDVECNLVALEQLFAAVGAPDQRRAAVLPCLMRGTTAEQNTVNVQWAYQINEPMALGVVRRARRAGTGCMVLSREALDRTVLAAELTTDFWRDDADGLNKAPLFQTIITEEGQWLGEDFSFCERLWRADVELVGILTGVSMHAGNALALEALR